jgi:ABC-type sugar transport system ATPase subunit
LRDISFSLKKGEILGFAGLMGAGRTELARAIFGAEPPERGEIRVHGKPVTIRTPADAVRAGIGYLSEDRKHYGLALGMDVRANIALASLPRYADRWAASTSRAGRDRPRLYRQLKHPHPRSTGKRCGCCRAATSKRWSSPNGCCAIATS